MTYPLTASANEQHLPTGPAIESKGMKKKFAKMKLVVIVINMNPPNSAHTGRNHASVIWNLQRIANAAGRRPAARKADAGKRNGKIIHTRYCIGQQGLWPY